MTLGDRLLILGERIALPSVWLTEKSKHKSVRVLGLLMAIPLFPFILVGIIVWIISLYIIIIEEI